MAVRISSKKRQITDGKVFMMKSFSRKFYLFLILFVLSAVWSIQYSQNYFQTIQSERQKIIDRAFSETSRLSADIQINLGVLPKSAQSIADLLSENNYSKSELIKLLKSELIKQPASFGVGVAYEPYRFDSTIRLYAPYVTHRDNVDLADLYDYTKSQYQRYSESIKGKPGWRELYFSEIAQQWIIEYVVPVKKNNDRIALVFISYSLASLQKRIDLTDLGEYGYSFIVDHTGRFVDYPIVDQVYAEEKYQKLSGFKTSDIVKASADISSKISGMVAYTSDITKKPSWMFYQPIGGMGWTAITVYEKPSLLAGKPESQRALLYLILLWSLTLLIFSGILLNATKSKNLGKYWFVALYVSIIFSVDIATLWMLSLQKKSLGNDPLITSIVSYADRDNFKKSYIVDSLLTRNSPPIFVPTGVFVQSVEFTSANNVIMTGYIWQRYFDKLHHDISKNIVMPEAESFEIVENYRRPRTEDNSVLIGSYFKVTLRQNFDYSRYPLDSQSLWIRMWHYDFDKNIVLIPMLESYERLNPDWLPGIEKDFVLSGWQMDRSFFDYHHNSYNTNFGIDNYVGQSNFPELYFNIVLKRDFFDSFVSQLAPLVVVLLMLFAIQVTSSKDERRNALLGFNTTGVLASSSALFFVVLISHIDLRSSLAAKEIIYLEVFYFVTYVTILIVSINSILFSWGIKFPVIAGKSWIQYRDNLIPKLLYWPMVCIQLLLLSLLALFP